MHASGFYEPEAGEVRKEIGIHTGDHRGMSERGRHRRNSKRSRRKKRRWWW